MIDPARLSPNPFAFHPGGRWERVLGACVASRWPLTRIELMSVSQSGRHTRRIERQKLWRATRAMTRAGLLEATAGPHGLIAYGPTAAGFRAVADHGGGARPD